MFKLFAKKSKRGDDSKDKEKLPRTTSVSERAKAIDERDASADTSLVRAPYEKKKRVYSKPVDVLNEILYRESGTVMDRITPKSKPQEVCVWFNPKTFLISWFSGSVKGKAGTQIGQGCIFFSSIFC